MDGADTEARILAIGMHVALSVILYGTHGEGTSQDNPFKPAIPRV
jgi:hypothetical protein